MAKGAKGEAKGSWWRRVCAKRKMEAGLLSAHLPGVSAAGVCVELQRGHRAVWHVRTEDKAAQKQAGRVCVQESACVYCVRA